MDFEGAIFYDTVTPYIEKDLKDFINDANFIDDAKNTVRVPIIFFDAVSASAFDSIHEGSDQYVGNPYSIELFGILALGYLRKGMKKYDLGQENFQFNTQKYLDSFLYANSFFVRNKYMPCKYYSFKKGKLGGKLVLELAEGSRRFGASYILALINNNLTIEIPCQLKVLVVDKEKAERMKEYLQSQIEELKGKQNSFLHYIINKIQRKFFKIRNKDSFIPRSIMDIIAERQEMLETIESDLHFANYTEPVLPELLSIVIGKAEEKDFIRIFEHFNTLEKKFFKDWLP